MYYLKFRKVSPEGVSECNVACPQYEVWLRNNHNETGADIGVYKGFLKKDGVEYHVGGPRDNAYDVCFVTNDAGKTIDRIGPFEKAEAA